MEDIDELKRQKAQFEGSLKSMLSAHDKLLGAMSEREQAVSEIESLTGTRRRPADRKRSSTSGKNPDAGAQNRRKLTSVPSSEEEQSASSQKTETA